MGVSIVFYSTGFWPTALKLGFITNFHMLFRMVGCFFGFSEEELKSYFITLLNIQMKLSNERDWEFNQLSTPF